MLQEAQMWGDLYAGECDGVRQRVSVTYRTCLGSPSPVWPRLPPLDALDVRRAQQSVGAYPQHHEGYQIDRNDTEAPSYQGIEIPCYQALQQAHDERAE